jgi:hypothetical protein
MPEDPFTMNQFDSGMIDLTNPSEIFQFDKDDLSCSSGPYAIQADESVQLQANYQDFEQVNQAAFDIDPKQRLDFVGYI